MRPRTLLAMGLAVFLSVPARAFQADLVPASDRPEAREIEGNISIGGEDGTIRVAITGVNDAREEPLDGRLSVTMKIRANGQRRRVAIPLVVDTGDGEVTTSLGLTPDSQVIVRDVRVRAPSGHTLAVAGVQTRVVAPTPTPTPAPPPTPDQCPAALDKCQSDLTFCEEELDACLIGE